MKFDIQTLKHKTNPTMTILGILCHYINRHIIYKCKRCHTAPLFSLMIFKFVNSFKNDRGFCKRDQNLGSLEPKSRQSKISLEPEKNYHKTKGKVKGIEKTLYSAKLARSDLARTKIDCTTTSMEYHYKYGVLLQVWSTTTSMQSSNECRVQMNAEFK